jgi:hypothetical protein
LGNDISQPIARHNRSNGLAKCLRNIPSQVAQLKQKLPEEFSKLDALRGE